MPRRANAALLLLLALPSCGDTQRHQFICHDPERPWIYRCDTITGEVWFARASPSSGTVLVREWQQLTR